MSETSETLGTFIKAAREQMQLTLRRVETETGISNAYLSQLESNKIKRPSPAILHKLATLYGVAYEDLLHLAGHPTVEQHGDTPSSRLAARIGPITADEEEAIVEYLRFIRRRRR